MMVLLRTLSTWNACRSSVSISGTLWFSWMCFMHCGATRLNCGCFFSLYVKCWRYSIRDRQSRKKRHFGSSGKRKVSFNFGNLWWFTNVQIHANKQTYRNVLIKIYLCVFVYLGLCICRAWDAQTFLCGMLTSKRLQEAKPTRWRTSSWAGMTSPSLWTAALLLLHSTVRQPKVYVWTYPFFKCKPALNPLTRLNYSQGWINADNCNCISSVITSYIRLVNFIHF